MSNRTVVLGIGGYVGSSLFKDIKDLGNGEIAIGTSTKAKIIDSVQDVIHLDILRGDGLGNLSQALGSSKVSRVISCAGFTKYIDKREMGDIDDETIGQMVSLNMIHAYKLLAFLQRNKDICTDRCHVFLVSSTAGLNGIGSNVVYAASKAAVNNLAISSGTWMDERFRVYALCPGLLNGGMTVDAPEEYKEFWKSKLGRSELPGVKELVRIMKELEKNDVYCSPVVEV